MTTGRFAMQADGAVLIQLGGTEVLATATASTHVREGIDFFPLTVDVEERMYAAGKIPGSFFRREGRPTERAILSARLIDRPLRPSFREGFRSETHVVATVISVDEVNPYDVLALKAASAALMVSPIPFEGPIAGVRMAFSHGEWIPMPSFQQLDDSVFDLLVAGKRNSSGGIDIVMVEAGATEAALRLIDNGQALVTEEAVAQGLEASKPFISALVDAQLELRSQVQPPEADWPVVVDYDEELYARVEQAAQPRLAEVYTIVAKKERNQAEDEALSATLADLGFAEDSEEVPAVKKAFRAVAKKVMRRRVVEEGRLFCGETDDAGLREHLYGAIGAPRRPAVLLLPDLYVSILSAGQTHAELPDLVRRALPYLAWLQVGVAYNTLFLTDEIGVSLITAGTILSVFGIAGVAAFYWLSLSAFRHDHAFAVSALYAVSYFQVWFSQNARGYTAMMLFFTLVSAQLVRFWQSGSISRRSGFAYAVSGVLVAYSHPVGMAIVPVQAAGGARFVEFHMREFTRDRAAQCILEPVSVSSSLRSLRGLCVSCGRPAPAHSR